MKRSKIFLGLTTCLLAIVGVAATKAHKFTTKHFGFFGTRSNTCNHQTVLKYFTNGSGFASTSFGRESSLPVYTKSSPTLSCPSEGSSRLYTSAID